MRVTIGADGYYLYLEGGMKTISLKIPEALDRELDHLAKQRRSSRSAVLREALEGLAGKQRKRSATGLAGELVGSLKGAPDLSSSPRHMRGYGK